MSNSNHKFWLGAVLGTLGGTLLAKKSFEQARMPNARVWQRLMAEKRDQIEAGTLMAQIEERYWQLHRHRPIFEQRAYNTHVEENILPGLALYQILRERGLESETALGEINELFEIWFNDFPPPRARGDQLMKLAPENFAFFRRAVRFVMEKMFPAPGWQVEYVHDDDNTLAFNIQRCFYLDILTYFKAPELTPVFCKLDDINMSKMPTSIRWGRTQTIGMGAECCDFRWDYVPTRQIETPQK